MDKSKNIFIIAASIIVAGIIIGAAVLYTAKDNTASLKESLPLPPSEETETPSLIEVDTVGHPFIGEEGAPIVIIDVGDYQCPFSKSFSLETLPEIKKKYVDEGKVKVVFRDFPLPYHPNAQKAAEAALCINDQDLNFYDYHIKLYENTDALDVESLKDYAEELEADMEEFNSCLDEGKFEQTVSSDFEDINNIIQSSNLDNFGTPAFFINGEPLIGARPFSEFQKIIESKLEKEIKE